MACQNYTAIHCRTAVTLALQGTESDRLYRCSPQRQTDPDASSACCSHDGDGAQSPRPEQGPTPGVNVLRVRRTWGFSTDENVYITAHEDVKGPCIHPRRRGCAPAQSWVGGTMVRQQPSPPFLPIRVSRQAGHLQGTCRALDIRD